MSHNKCRQPRYTSKAENEVARQSQPKTRNKWCGILCIEGSDCGDEKLGNRQNEDESGNIGTFGLIQSIMRG